MADLYIQRHGGDEDDKKSILGERSVQHVLYETHYMLELKPQGVEKYVVYSTREKKGNYNENEIDLIEEWKDANGVKHKKAHEVKCEPATFESERGSDKRASELDVLFRAVMTNKPINLSDGHGGEFFEDWEPMPTGNYIIEDYKRGWLGKVRNSTEFMAEKHFTDGRDIWFVSYVPKPDIQKTIIENHTRLYYDSNTKATTEISEDGNDYILEREPSRGFLMACISDKKFIQWFDAHKAELETTAANKNKYKLPLEKLYPDIPRDNKTGLVVFGIESRNTGAKWYLDKKVWEREAKDYKEEWTDDDLKIEMIKTF